MIRHGRAASAWGVSADPGLAPEGREQALEAATTMQAMAPMPIVSSPMARARQTAAPLANAWKCTPEIDPRFSEIPTPTNIPTDRRAWINDVLSRRWDAMEPELQVWRDDLLAAVQSLKQDTVVFTHFIAINTIAGCALADERVTVFMPDNASITTIDASGSSMVLLFKGREMPTLVG